MDGEAALAPLVPDGREQDRAVAPVGRQRGAPRRCQEPRHVLGPQVASHRPLLALERASRHDERVRYQFTGELRSPLATTCLAALEPDLITLDEFQRFKSSYGDDDASRLAQGPADNSARRSRTC